MILTQLPGQELHLEVFDYDMDMKDDFMGRYSHKELTGIFKFNKVLKITSTLSWKIQTEDQPKGHHWLAVQWSGLYAHKYTNTRVNE